MFIYDEKQLESTNHGKGERKLSYCIFNMNFKLAPFRCRPVRKK